MYSAIAVVMLPLLPRLFKSYLYILQHCNKGNGKDDFLICHHTDTYLDPRNMQYLKFE